MCSSSLSRSLLALVAISSAMWIAGCGDDEEEKKEYIQVGHSTVTGFYMSPYEGGHLYIVYDQWRGKARAGLAAALHPSNDLPVGARVILTPDDGSAPIELLGYGNTTSASGGGYRFDLSYIDRGRMEGYISSPHGNGYCRGLVGSPDSIDVYLGTFSGGIIAGDTLNGRWNFVGPDTSQLTTYPIRINFIGLAIDSANPNGIGFFDGYYLPSQPGPDHQMSISGFWPSSTNWSGSGTLSLDENSASGTSGLGDWSATRHVFSSP